jgi:hypothetical protein
MRAIKALLAGVALAALAACAGVAPAVVYRDRAILPPADLLQDCQHAPKPPGNTVLDLANMLVDERAVVESCDWGDKAALRQWAAANAPASGVVAGSAPAAN